MVFLAELINIALKVKALFYSFETILNSYESKYKTIFPYNHLFQTVCLAVVVTSPSYIRKLPNSYAGPWAEYEGGEEEGRIHRCQE